MENAFGNAVPGDPRYKRVPVRDWRPQGRSQRLRPTTFIFPKHYEQPGMLANGLDEGKPFD